MLTNGKDKESFAEIYHWQNKQSWFSSNNQHNQLKFALCAKSK